MDKSGNCQRMKGLMIYENDHQESNAGKGIPKIEPELDSGFIDENTKNLDLVSSISVNHVNLLPLQPPENFANVVGQIYRSSFPRPENFPFLNKLRLKSIVVLVPEEYPPENLEFFKLQNTTLFNVPISGNKEPFINIPESSITEILQIVLDPENHPLLIHCNRGKHRTGCVVGCIRKLQNWSLTMIFDEYRRFAAPKIRSLDQQFIELYEEDKIVEIASKKNWLPITWN